MVFLSILFLRERLISFQRDRLEGLWDLCHYTPSHTPSGRCLRCLVEDRSFSPTVQSHYGLTVTPSFLLGSSQDGIIRVYYRLLSARLWLMRNKGMCTLVCTRMLPAEWGLGWMPSYSALMRWGCFRHRCSLPCVMHKHVTTRLGGFISEIWEFITITKEPLCLFPLSVNAQNLYSFISAVSVQLEFGTVAHHHCRTRHISIKD